jgi:hypothetical protein
MTRRYRLPAATPIVALFLVLVAAACASSNAAILDTTPANVAPDTTPKTLMFVVNPSARARALALDHAGQIVRGAAVFNLTLLGIYEEPVGIRKAPFNRPFISDQVPSVGTAPTPPAKPHCGGTEFQTKKCERAYGAAVDKYNVAVQAWRNANGSALEAWKGHVSKALAHLAKNGPTEEAPDNRWDIRGAFLQVGQDVQALDTSRNCVVLLGGVAVRTPPDRLRADLLKGSTVIIPGWTGTQKVQDRWSERLSKAGANPVFLPQAVTDIKLVPTVAACLKGIS